MASSWSLTAWATVTVLASGSLVIESVSEVLPFTREIEVVSTGCSATVAMSDSFTGPSVPWTSIAPISSALAKVVPVWTSRLASSPRIVPDGIALPLAAKYCAIVAGSTPRSSISAWS